MPFHVRTSPAWLLRAILLGILAFWLFEQMQPVQMPALNLAAGERVQCVSYAPYYKPGMTPFIENQTISPEQIDADLKALSPYAGCVRIYSIDQGLDQVVPTARKYGMKVLVGAWLGREEKKNALELSRAIALVNQNQDVVRALIVGNEVLLRKDLSLEQLAAHIQNTKAQSKVPVTYADVWEFWIRYDSLAKYVDLITAHILPFWEDEPVNINHAMEHMRSIRGKVAEHFKDKSILIGETGWPSAGRQREHSAATLVNEARFMREFVALARQEGWDYNFIEAVDQPWKRVLEGTVGGYWGFLDANLQPKFSLTAPVTERTSVSLQLSMGVLGAILCALLAAWRRAGKEHIALSGLMGALAGVALSLQWEHAIVAYRNATEWTVLGGVSLLAICLPLCIAASGGVLRAPAADVAWQQWRQSDDRLASTNAILRALLLFACALGALWLLIDPRYRDFPSILYLIPALECALLPWLCRSKNAWSRAEGVSAACLLLSVIGRWASEPSNPQAILWLSVGVAFAIPCLHHLWLTRKGY